MKKVLAFVLAVLMITAITAVFASAVELPANKQAIVDACNALHSGTHSVEAQYVNRVITYLEKLGTDDITKEQSDSAIANVAKVQVVIDSQPGKQVSQFSAESKEEILSLIEETAALFNYTFIYDGVTKNVIVFDSSVLGEIPDLDVTDREAVKEAIAEAVENPESEVAKTIAKAKVDEAVAAPSKTFEDMGYEFNWIWVAVIAVVALAGGVFAFRKVRN